MKIYDISIPLSNQTIIYPGNSPVEIESIAKLPEDSSALSKISFGSHTGTHLDAPSHAILDGKTIDQIPLEKYIGPCQVFDFSHLKPGQAVGKDDLESKGDILVGDRVLLKTSNSDRGFDSFYEDFVYLGGEAAEYLASKQVSLVGIDYLSIKQRGSSDNRPHTVLLEKEIAILEGINLKDISEGRYELSCLPLKIIGVDGSPTRAILIDNQ